MQTVSTTARSRGGTPYRMQPMGMQWLRERERERLKNCCVGADGISNLGVMTQCQCFIKCVAKGGVDTLVDVFLPVEQYCGRQLLPINISGCAC
jgi:hypothetical protein